MRYAIIGGGISGLSAARMLQEAGHEAHVYEAADRPGGLVKCDRVGGHLFHRTGGHVFNTKRTDVLDWFWRQFDRDKEFTKADRNSVVSMADGRLISYPIENHAYQFSDQMLRAFIADLMTMAAANAKEGRLPACANEPRNFEEFLRARFGETLYREYFKPYNEKIWRRPLSNVPLSWLEGKLPMPTIDEMLYHNISRVEERAFVHSTFYYPVNGGSQFIVDRLAQGLDIRCNNLVGTLQLASDGWLVDGHPYDRVVFCGNIKQLPAMVQGIDLMSLYSAIDTLEAHGTTTVLCEIQDNPYSWIYMPSPAYYAHRIICTGNFAPGNRAEGRMSATVEFTDYISEDEIRDNLTRIPFAPRYLAHNYSQYTYPIQAPGTRELINAVKSLTEPHGLYLLGRFAEWEYYNMDAAMGAALTLIHRLHP